jgi:hypothetical protein
LPANNAQKGVVEGDAGADFSIGPSSRPTPWGPHQGRREPSIVGPTKAFGAPVNIFTPGFAHAFMNATLSDNTNVMLDTTSTMERLEVYAGWEWIEFTKPSNPFTIPGTGFNDIAGDFVCFDCQTGGSAARRSTPAINFFKIG